jgi:hypothetical protein
MTVKATHLEAKTVRTITMSLVLSFGVLAGACGSHGPASPTGPSGAIPTAPTPGGVSTGTTISGTVLGMNTASRWTTLASGLTVTISGTSSTSTVDNNGRFTFQNVPSGRIDLHFTGAGIDAHLELDDVAEHETITITVRVTTNAAELENHEREDANHNAEVEGRVVTVAGNTLTVGTKMVNVTAATRIVHGDTVLTLASIHVGDRIHVHGTLNGTAVDATKIEVQNGADTPGRGDEQNEMEISGSISNKTGTCPALTFTVGSTAVVTNASTQFKDVACTALANNMRVEVKGTRQSTGSILATRVEGKDEDKAPGVGAEVELKGAISGKGGTCPALSFTVSTTPVVTNASTQFKDIACASLANGTAVEVKGTKQSSGSVLATRVEKNN